jgi:fatty acid desaturase
MGTNDRQHQFEQIVAQLRADYPSLSGRRRWPRRVVITAAVLGGILWGLLSVAMVAWGAAGVILTCAVVALTALALGLDAYRHRDR